MSLNIAPVNTTPVDIVLAIKDASDMAVARLRGKGATTALSF